MIRESWLAARGTIRHIPELWRKTGLLIAGVLLFEVGARIALPSLDGEVLRDYITRGAGGGLLTLYDLLVSGGLSRGAILALGFMPYLSARIFVRIARTAFPAVGELATSDAGSKELARGTRLLTLAIALIQAYGYAHFIQSLPGVVARPGIGFIAQTMLVLTAGTMGVMWLSEQIIGRGAADGDHGDDEEVGVPALEHRAFLLPQPAQYSGLDYVLRERPQEFVANERNSATGRPE